jgi:hypothetical protein
MDVAADFVDRWRYLIGIGLGCLSLSRRLRLESEMIRHLWETVCDCWTRVGVDKRPDSVPSVWPCRARQRDKDG